MSQPRKIGRYEIKEELGRGGFATVYRAVDPRLPRDVAIKVLPRHFLHDPTFAQKFMDEAKLVASLEHSAIVPIYDFGGTEDDDEAQPYLVMRLLSRGSLRDRLTREGRLSLAETSRILNRLAPALDKAHRRGIIHRDIKPENVMFDEDNQPLLTDFGIARITEATHTMTIIGTPPYMSPEQWGGQPLDGRSDIYALGVLLYETLAGQRPYLGNAIPALINQHLNAPVPDIRAVNDTLPAALQDVISQALAKDRVRRFPTAAALSTALARIATTPPASEVSVEATEVIRPDFLPPDRPETYAGDDVRTVREAQPSPAAETAALIADEKRLTSELSPVQRGAQDHSASKSSSARRGNESMFFQTFSARLKRQPLLTGGIILGIFGLLGIGIITVIFTISQFGGGDGTPVATATEAAIVIADLDTETPTETPTATNPLPTMTATPPQTGTSTSTPTVTASHTSTLTPTHTSTRDPDVPPAAASLGDTWVRPIDGMTMVYVPGGQFRMGAADGDENAASDEFPQRTVQLSPFWIGQTEVTNAQFAAFLNEEGNQSDGSVTWFDIGYVFAQISSSGSRFIADSSFGDHPVIAVSWYGAAAYCDWAGGTLPTEAQWEYAARGPDASIYPWGNQDPTCSLAQYEDCGGRTMPVGSFPSGASWAGALDMAGNVWEWVNDWYVSPYPEVSGVDVDPTGPASGDRKVLRGGRWNRNAINLRASNRGTTSTPASASIDIGFRCAVVPGQ